MLIAQLFVHVEDVADRELFMEVHKSNMRLMNEAMRLEEAMIAVPKQPQYTTTTKVLLAVLFIALVIAVVALIACVEKLHNESE